MTKNQPVIPIAIVGMAGTFPGALNIAEFWQNIVQAKSSITKVPKHRWPESYFDPSSSQAHKFYARQGGFIDAYAQFEALRFGVMPRSAEGAEPDQLMTLQICAEALEDAGYAPKLSELGQRGRDFDRKNCEVIIGRGGYIGPAMNALNLRVRTVEQLGALIHKKSWLSPEQIKILQEEILAEVRPFGPDTAIGLVPNLCASRVADRLALGGAAYTIDAACASALLAVSRACESLQSGRANLALAGGVHMVHDLTFWSVFTQLGALSRNEIIRPFDASADGLLIGEGVGVLVLKRLQDALSDGDRVYAVIQGIGESSDGGQASLMSPDQDGQVRAMRQAWVGLDLKQVGLIEAHGTGTPTGDQVELSSTLEVFGHEGEAVGLGSVKSNIGHCMPAAGAAGLIKAALSIYHGYKPQSLNIDQAHPLFSGRLYPLQKGEFWESDERWAGVSAFGFGGINAHIALSQSPIYSPLRPKLARLKQTQSLLAVASENEEDLALELESLANTPQLLNRTHQRGDGSIRAVLLDPTPDALKAAAKLVRSGQSRQGRKGLWLIRNGLLSTQSQTKDNKIETVKKRPTQGEDHHQVSAEKRLGKVAFMFPGVEASFTPRIDDLCARLGIPSPNLYAPQQLGERGVSVVRLGMSLNQCLQRLGIEPDYICGHSIGEWTGLITAGYFPKESIEPFIDGLDPQGLSTPEVSFIAVGAGVGNVQKILVAEFGPMLTEQGIYCSHDNCPHQSIYCVPLSLSKQILKTLAEAKLMAQELPFRSGFHAPHFEPFAQGITKHLKTLTLQTPSHILWSATTNQPYPQDDPQTFYELNTEHLVKTVRFRTLIETLYEQGVRVFIQMGVGSLSSFVSDTLRGRPHRVIDAHSERRDAWSQYLHLAATLYAEGIELNFEVLQGTAYQRDRAIDLDLGTQVAPLEQTIALSSEREHSDLLAVRDVGAQKGLASYPNPLALHLPSKQSSQSQRYEATWSLSIEDFPYLEDHCFFRQAVNWPILEDRFPVVPMTLSIQWVMEVAKQLVNEADQNQKIKRHIVAVRNVRAAKWIEIEPAQDVKVTATWRSEDNIYVEILGHLSALVILSQTPLTAPLKIFKPQEQEVKVPINGSEVYSKRWMFHGPAYHGITELIGISPQGIRGRIHNTGIPGALLDNVGQIFGLWVMLTQREDRVVMPVRLEELTLHMPPPEVGALLDCEVSITKLEKREVKADMTLWHEGQVWASFKGWSDWRFETSGQLWSLMRYPEHNLYASPVMSHGDLAITLAEGISQAASSREFLVGRCLNQRERHEYRGLSPNLQRDWLAGRVASKDALRHLVWQRAQRPIYPAEIALTPRVSQQAPSFDQDSLPGDLRFNYPLSISHSAGKAVAVVATPNAQVSALGIDLEEVVGRDGSWRQASFSREELQNLSNLPLERHDEALTLWWTLKEASAKCASQSATQSVEHRLNKQVHGLGSPKLWTLHSWQAVKGSPLTLLHGLEPLSQGVASIYSKQEQSIYELYWWIFDCQSQRFCMALCRN